MATDFLRKIRGLFIKGFEPTEFTPVPKVSGGANRGFANREEFLDKIFVYFKNEFKKKTTRRSILYPTSFLIYLHPQDYENQEQDFMQTVKDAVEDFYNYIHDHLKSPDYIPHSPCWLFQFCSFSGISVENKDEEITEVPKGEVFIISDTFPVDFSKENVLGDGNVKGTLHAKNSAKELAINHDLFLSITKLEKDKWQIDWNNEDFKNGKIANTPMSYAKNRDLESESYAVLTCGEQFMGTAGKKGIKYFMVDKLIEISGKNDTRPGTHIAKVDNEKMLDSHVQIKYIPEVNKFQLAAFGETKLNERPVKLSSGGNIYWNDLSDNSDIFINNEIGITFKRSR